MDTRISELVTSLLRSGKPLQIKLLGDSITHGVGGTGFAMDGEPIVGDFRRSPNAFCWAKLLADRLPDCKVINNGCSGTTIQFVTQFFDQLVSPEDDIIICTIGTNNRHQYCKDAPKRDKAEFAADVYGKILALHDKAATCGKPVIFVANIPAAPTNECDQTAEGGFWRILHMCDINALYKKAAAERGFLLISLYDLFSDYCASNQIPLEDLLADGLHPNDRGYQVMFDLLSHELGIA